MDQPFPIIVVLAGLCSGAVLGVSIATETERRIRRNGAGWTLFNNSHWLGLILNEVIRLLILVLILTGVCVAILQIGNAYPLTQPDRYTLGGLWLAGALLAKWLRYEYWKRRA